MIIVLFGAAALCWAAFHGSPDAFSTPSAHRAADVTLASTAGTLNIAYLHRPAIVVFGYVGCPDTCPITLRAVDLAARDLPIHPPPLVLFVDVDPRDDNLDRIRAFTAHYYNVHGATGTIDDLAQLEESLGMRAIRTRAALPAHDARIFVLGSDGALLGTLAATPSPVDVRDALHGLLAGSAEAQPR